MTAIVQMGRGLARRQNTAGEYHQIAIGAPRLKHKMYS